VHVSPQRRRLDCSSSSSRSRVHCPTGESRDLHCQGSALPADRTGCCCSVRSWTFTYLHMESWMAMLTAECSHPRLERLSDRQTRQWRAYYTVTQYNDQSPCRRCSQAQALLLPCTLEQSVL
jgi:hypothetical protein